MPSGKRGSADDWEFFDLVADATFASPFGEEGSRSTGKYLAETRQTGWNVANRSTALSVTVSLSSTSVTVRAREITPVKSTRS